jgi:hypothetical protein
VPEELNLESLNKVGNTVHNGSLGKNCGQGARRHDCELGSTRTDNRPVRVDCETKRIPQPVSNCEQFSDSCAVIVSVGTELSGPRSAAGLRGDKNTVRCRKFGGCGLSPA